MESAKLRMCSLLCAQLKDAAQRGQSSIDGIVGALSIKHQQRAIARVIHTMEERRREPGARLGFDFVRGRARNERSHTGAASPDKRAREVLPPAKRLLHHSAFDKQSMR